MTMAKASGYNSATVASAFISICGWILIFVIACILHGRIVPFYGVFTP